MRQKARISWFLDKLHFPYFRPLPSLNVLIHLLAVGSSLAAARLLGRAVASDEVRRGAGSVVVRAKANAALQGKRCALSAEH